MNPLLAITGSGLAFLLTASADQPMWLVVLVSVFVPIMIALIVKAADIGYKEFCFRREERKRFGTPKGDQ